MDVNRKFNYKKVRFYILIVLLFSFIGQTLFFDTINTISSLLVASVSYFTFSAIFRKNIFPKAIFASFIVISFNISILSGPLVFQTLLFTPITNNLQVPLRVFFFSSLFQISLIIALYLYVNSSVLSISSAKINFYLKKIGVMKVPTKLQLWIMGVIGLSITFYYAGLNAMGGVEYGDVGNKFLFALRFLTYAPFLILFRNQMSEKRYKLKKNDFILLGIYFTILLIGAIALNSRGTFAQAILIVVILTVLFVLVKKISIQKIKKRLIIIVLLIGFLQPVLSDLAIAMVLARSDRGEVSPRELVAKTIEIYQNKQMIEDRIKKDRLQNIILSSNSYNEYYIDSTFLSRFLNIKFSDNMFALESTIDGKNSEQILDITNQKILATLPSPILKTFGFNINKNDLSFSMGDYMLYLDGKTFLGGFKVGSTVAHIFAIFSWFSYIIVIIIFLVLFMFIESLTTKKDGITVMVSPVLMLMMLPLYYITSGDSFVNVVAFILRILPQNIFIYLIVFYFVYIVSRLLKFTTRA